MSNPDVATDLNQSMLDQALAIGTRRPVEWRQADAMHLPFLDGTLLLRKRAADSSRPSRLRPLAARFFDNHLWR